MVQMTEKGDVRAGQQRRGRDRDEESERWQHRGRVECRTARKAGWPRWMDNRGRDERNAGRAVDRALVNAKRLAWREEQQRRVNDVTG